MAPNLLICLSLLPSGVKVGEILTEDMLPSCPVPFFTGALRH